MQLVHLASRLYGTPLLIARPKLDVILSVLGSRIGLPDIETALPVPTPKKASTAPQVSIAVIPVYGTLVRRSMGLEAASGLMSYAEIDSRLEAALADSQVSGILFELDSPGGEAGGVFELAQRIRAAGQIKPVWAHANDAAYSAAYAIAAAADRLTLSQTAGVGSIGVIALHVDQSVKDAKDGLTYSAIYAGHHKNNFSPHEPLTPQAATALQTEVDRLYDIFVTQVGEMRGLESEAVRATQAGVYFGETAVAAGLADAVTTFDQVLAEFADALAAQRPGTARSPKARHATLARASPEASTSPVLSNSAHSPLEPNMNEHEDTEQLSTAPDPAPEPAPKAEPQEQEHASQPAPAANAALAHAPDGGRIEALAIAELCLIAGCAQRTAEFLVSGMTEAQVRRVLLDARADQPEIASRITADAGSSQRPEDSPVVAAVKKLTAKE